MPDPIPIPRTVYANPSSRGFIALTSLVIISAIVLAISVGVSLRSTDGAKTGMEQEFSARALAAAHRCAEEALMRLKEDLQYGGGQSIIEMGESCDILPVAGSGNTNRTVETQSTISGRAKKIRVVAAQINPLLIIDTWDTIPDF
jgi:hypothetical protein